MNKLFLGIIALGLLLRVVGLSSHPSGFTPDEASFGYDAYSILKTGHDQWNQLLPLNFRSFGDFKLPLYVYITIPSVAFFGLNEFAVRLPNAIVGTLAIIAVYFLVKETFRELNLKIGNFKLEIIASFLLATSPWHIPMSRGAFEANLTTLLLPTALLFFFKGIKNKKYFVVASLFFGLNLFSYHSARILTPLLVLFLVWKYKRGIKKNIYSIGSVVVLLGFIALAGFTMVSGAGARAATAGIFNPTGGWGATLDSQYKAKLVGESPILARVFNNKPVYLLSTFLESYLSYFSPQFLFTQGPNEGTYGMLPGRGVMYLFEIVFVLYFIWGVCTKKFRDVSWLLFWLLLAPIAPSLTKGPGFAANRAEFAVPAVQIISALGAFLLYQQIKKLFLPIFGFVFCLSFLFFLEGYWIAQPATQSKAMIYGMKQIYSTIDKNHLDEQYSEIIISKKISEPHIYAAFYQKLDPALVQTASQGWLRYETEKKDWVDQLGTYRLYKLIFKSIDQIADFKKPNVVLIGEPSDFPENITPNFKVSYPDGSPAYYIVTTSNTFAIK